MSFTIVLKFSRDWCLDPFFKRFNSMKFDRGECNLIMINNTQDLFISIEFFRHLAEKINEFKTIQIIQTNQTKSFRNNILNSRGVPHPFHTWSSQKSFQMIKLIGDLVRDEIHIQLEDDTLPHVDTINLLLLHMKDPKVSIAFGPVPHRERGFKVVGHNAYNLMKFDENGFLLARSNFPVYKIGVYECEAAGYCNIAFRKEPYKKAIQFIENLKVGIRGSGSDIYFTNSMKKSGGKILCDFSLWGEHMFQDNGKLKKNSVENTRQWDWVYNLKKRYYNIKFID